MKMSYGLIMWILGAVAGGALGAAWQKHQQQTIPPHAPAAARELSTGTWI